MRLDQPLSILESMRRQSPRHRLLLSLTIVALLGIADFRTGWELSFSIFYLVPIAVASWGGGRRGGIVVAALCVVVGFGTDYLAGSAYSSNVVHVWNVTARLGVFVTVAVTLVALRSALDQAREQAERDPLTGIPNARGFFARLDQEMADARRHGRPLTLAFVDVDDFKNINDTLGHRAGDEVLRKLSASMCAALRSADLVGRLGGDEFAILLPRTDASSARHAIAHVLDATRAEIVRNAWPISLSVGAVTVRNGKAGSEDVLHAADELMYRVKRAGKGDFALESYRQPEIEP